jgi:hypothetical protein
MSSIEANALRLKPEVNATIVVIVVVTVEIMADNHTLFRSHSAYKGYCRRHNYKQKNIS